MSHLVQCDGVLNPESAAKHRHCVAIVFVVCLGYEIGHRVALFFFYQNYFGEPLP